LWLQVLHNGAADIFSAGKEKRTGTPKQEDTSIFRLCRKQEFQGYVLRQTAESQRKYVQQS